jgi:hypothetical protein
MRIPGVYTGTDRALQRFLDHDVQDGDLEIVERVCREVLQAEIEDHILEETMEDVVASVIANFEKALSLHADPPEDPVTYAALYAMVPKEIHDKAEHVVSDVIRTIADRLVSTNVIRVTAGETERWDVNDLSACLLAVIDKIRSVGPTINKVDPIIRSYVAGIFESDGYLVKQDGAKTTSVTLLETPTELEDEIPDVPLPPCSGSAEDGDGEEIPF